MTTGKTIPLTDHILCHSYHIWMSTLIPKSQCLMLKLPKAHLTSHSRMSDAKSWLIWKDPDAGKDWRQEEMGDRGWDGWMASLTQWTWVWVNSRSWWWTGRPGILQSMGSKRVEHDRATELNWMFKLYTAYIPVRRPLYCSGNSTYFGASKS